MLYENLEDFLHRTAFLAACEEFTIAISTCAPLAEAIIGYRVYDPLARDLRQVATASVDIAATFEDDRSQTEGNRLECGEKTGGSGTDDDDNRGIGGNRRERDGRDDRVDTAVIAQSEAKG